MEKELKIVPPEGYEIDKENSTFDCIKFKPIKPIRWRDKEDKTINGYWLSSPDDMVLTEFYKRNCHYNYGIFTSKQLAKSALAMAKISQIMANDERFGGPVTNEEWGEGEPRYTIIRFGSGITTSINVSGYSFLAFHTEEQRNLFIEENEDLIKDYFML